MDQFIDEKQKKYIFNSVIGVLVVLAIFLGVKVISSVKEYSYIGRGTYAANVITVSGKGEVLSIPDVATFSFSVVETGKTVKEAQDKASTKMNSVLDTIKASGVAEKDIKTTSYSSYPKYEYNNYPTGKNVLIGYEVSQSITVKIRKTDNAGTLLAKVGSMNVSNISGLDFIVDDADKVQAEARDKAIADAKDKAGVLAKALGVKLTKIVNFYESGNQPIYYAMDSVSSKGMGGNVDPTPEIPVGENKIVSNVTITYEVGQ